MSEDANSSQGAGRATAKVPPPAIDQTDPSAADSEHEAPGAIAAQQSSIEATPTLRDVFSLPEEKTDPADDHWRAFQDRVSKEVKGIKWTATVPDLAAKVCELLDIKLSDVLLTAWKKVNEFQSVLEKSKLTPDETIYLELAQHTINSEHRPSIDVKIKGATVKKIELTIHLGFNLKGFLLKIQNGAIEEIQTGQCEAKGTIKYSGLTVAEKKLQPLKLPYSIQIPAELSHALLAAPPETDETRNVERIEL